MKVSWTTPALSDLSAIAACIADDSPAAAQRVLGRIRAQVGALAELPHRGRQGETPGTRRLIVEGTSYIVIYRVDPMTVSVLAVFHGARERPDLL